MKSKPFLREILNFSISNASDFFSCTTMKSKNGWFTSSSCDCRKIKNIISSIFFKDFHWKKVIAELDIVHQQTMFQLVSVEKQKTLVNFLFTRVYLHLFVPRPGVEPGWKWIHWCLRPARLPIPPSGHNWLFNCGAKIRFFS